MARRRVVITGMGAVTPLGLDVAALWAGLLAGRSGIGPVTAFDTSDLEVRIAGEVGSFDPTAYLEAKEARRLDRFTQLAVAASAEALAQAGLPARADTAARLAVVAGSAIGGIHTYTRENAVLGSRGPRALSPFLIPAITVDAPAVQIALRTGARGPCLGVATTCASGADALGIAWQLLREGSARAAVVTGSEAAVTPIGLAAFARMRALSRRNDEPATACRPFDATRDGFVLAEGAGAMVLEDEAHAVSRGAEPLAELAGYAASSDAWHLTAPDATGSSAAACIRAALRRARVRPAEVGYVNAHGTGTPAGDPAEVRALRCALGPALARIPVSSTKSMTGHMIGAAGVVEAAISVLAMRHGVVPPTVNLVSPDPECVLPVPVPGTPRAAAVGVALSVSFGFGGHNAALVLRTWCPG